MINQRKALHLTGETIREVGILLVVFTPLDAFFQMDHPPVPLLGGIMILALLLIVIGLILEVED
jgi:hypothetical protein